jgi:hypothetical protein
MNTLTANRILQKGDEYRDNGTWKPVPANDYGLQIMFTTYKEVRRPTETPFVHGGAPAVKVEPEKPAAKAEKVTPVPTAPLAQSEKEIVDAGLPTFVSRKAHSGKPIGFDHKGKLVREKPETSKDATTEVAESPASPTPLPPAPVGLSKPISAIKPISAEIVYPISAPPCIWTGRNGTFTARGLNIHHTKGGQVMLIPVGKRGVAKNALIEFPAEVIPDVIDFLTRTIKL